MVAEPLALRVAPTPGALAPSNGTGGSISSDWVALPPRNNQSPKIMRKSDPVWRSFGPQDDPYMRAIFLGQGCWERLDSISEDRARRIMEAWGAEGQDAIPDKY